MPQPQNENVVVLKDLQLSYGEQVVINGLNLEIGKGKTISILGPGGCGKSSLLKIMGGILPSDSGHVEILNQDLGVLAKEERSAHLRKIGFAFQQGALFDFMTVRENILFAMENMTDLPPQEMEERIFKFLEGVNLPAAGRKMPSELSGGMRRRVGIVRALITEPELALLDEPTAGLDPVTSTLVIDMIHRLAEQTHSTLVCVTSSVEVAFTFSKHVAVMRDGKLSAQGDWKALNENGDEWLRDFLGKRGFTPPSQ